MHHELQSDFDKFKNRYESKLGRNESKSIYIPAHLVLMCSLQSVHFNATNDKVTNDIASVKVAQARLEDHRCRVENSVAAMKVKQMEQDAAIVVIFEMQCAMAMLLQVLDKKVSDAPSWKDLAAIEAQQPICENGSEEHPGCSSLAVEMGTNMFVRNIACRMLIAYDNIDP